MNRFTFAIFTMYAILYGIFLFHWCRLASGLTINFRRQYICIALLFIRFPGSLINFYLILHPGPFVLGRYTVAGKYRVQVIIEDVVLNQHISKTVDVEVTCNANITFPSHVGLIVQPVNEPLLVRRDIIQNCTSAPPSEEWHIYQGTPKSDQLPLPVNVEIRPRFGLVVPPYTLVPAMYTIEMKVISCKSFALTM